MKGETFDRMVSLLFPRGCVLCGKTVAYDDFICGDCIPDRLEGDGNILCARCGKLKSGCVCGTVDWAFEGAAGALFYREKTRDAVIRLKKLPDQRIARYLAGEMAYCLAEQFPGVPFDLVTEVPMHPEKLARRKFNHSELLAAELAALAHISHRMRLLACEGPVEYQHSLGRKERFAAVQSRYSPAGNCCDKIVLLVDDVMTTGATAHACAEVLMAAGAAEVYVLTATSTDKLVD